MDYDLSDSSGTGDDLPPLNQNRVRRVGRVAGNGRSAAVGSAPYPRLYDMESQIHHLEQEAYISVLRAFKAQSDAITWEKESLITELRKELRVSDEEHRELLGRVNADEIILRIREWRKAGHQPGLHTSAQPSRDVIGSTFRKKQKTLNPVPSLYLDRQIVASMQPSLSAAKLGAVVGARGKKPKLYPSTGPTGRGLLPNRGFSGTLLTNGPVVAGASDPLIGKKVMTRWPEDNNFYEAVITDYDPLQGRHALVYDMHTDNEAFEWVNLKEISPEDIRWEGENLGIPRQGGRGIKKSMDHDGVQEAKRMREDARSLPEMDIPSLQNSNGKKSLDDIQMIHTETIIEEVEKVFRASPPDLLEIEKAKKMLKEHEKTLIDTLARIADASDGESDEGENANMHEQSMAGDVMLTNGKNYGNEQHVALGIENGMKTKGEEGVRGKEGSDDGGKEGKAGTSNDQHDEMVIVDDI